MYPDQGGQQPDRARPDDQYGLGVPEGALADGEDLLPGLGDDGRGFQQDSQDPKALVDPDRVLWFDPPALGHEAVDLLDAALGVAAVGAHVPLANGAVRAGHWVRPAHNAHDMLADRQFGGSRVDHPA